ncbi:unnamed protein product [Meganyctiphanes norvegica]|uniref:Frizzled-4 n=1 Tax=Meganyctiphanes norvegica TaxID=48144 RepID=A0AAV2RFL5_MEGNR
MMVMTTFRSISTMLQSLIFLILLASRCSVQGRELGGDPSYGLERPRSCERITVPMCKEMPYNKTRMPNLLGHFTQNEAAIHVHEFMPMVNLGCSKYLRFFLCSLYAPMCTTVSGTDIPSIPSCKSICLEVKSTCLPLLQSLNYTWPAPLECERLPTPSDGGLCMEFPNITSSNVTQKPPHKPPWTSRPASIGGVIQGVCPPRQTWVATRDGGVCAPLCTEDVLFRSADKHFAEVWMVVWGSLCFVSTLFTVLTFWLEPSRFRYPERSIICLSICYLIYSLAYVSRLVLSSELLSCETNHNGISHLAVEGLETYGCIVTFILQYYFGMASSIWWVVLTLTWFLSAGKKWSPEALQAYASYFHAASWGLPAIATFLILIFKQVDGDELSGLCYVGNVESWAHMGFVVAPLSSLLVLGMLFIGLGFVALFKIRKAIKHQSAPVSPARAFAASISFSGHSSSKRLSSNIINLEKLMVRIGVFSVLYVLPAVCLIACHVYEHINKHRWKIMASVAALDCSQPSMADKKKHYYETGSLGCTLEYSIPSVEIFMLKIFMSLVVGITSGMWIWSAKTMVLWQRFFMSCCNSRSPQRKKDGQLYRMAAQVPTIIGTDSNRQAFKVSHHHHQSGNQQQQQQQQQQHQQSLPPVQAFHEVPCHSVPPPPPPPSTATMHMSNV